MTDERIKKEAIELAEVLRMRKMDFNAMDNRKCTVCDFVFDQDCDDCPAMPSQIRSLHHPTKRTQGVAHKGANRMIDKTAIDALTACAELEKLVITIEQYEEYTDGQPALGTCKSLVEIKKASRKAREALAALEAEKPAEDAEECLSKMFRDIRKIGYITDPLRLTNESHDACVDLLNHFAEAYHAKQCQICQRNELPDFARFENRSSSTTDVDK